jgi:hypothetical protein|tara:strand:- start:523 stop:729 length:207 start_codon:yes stop_codon:yes gene_type:complete
MAQCKEVVMFWSSLHRSTLHECQQGDRQIGEVPTHDVSYGMVRYGQQIHGLSNPSEPKAKIKHITSSS